jgi:uncharacterized phage protein (TIGR01671 family)
MSNYRFKETQLRAWNKTTKKMHYRNTPATAFILGPSGFSVVEIDSVNFNIEGVLADETDSVLMTGVGLQDDDKKDIYEGDIVFMRRPTKKGLLPIGGVVNAKDFTFSVNSGVAQFMLGYSDKNIQVLGNVFENTDEELAAKLEELFKKYPLK